MRAPALLVVSLGAAVALVSAPAASAHLTPEPSFVAAGSRQRLVLNVHNDRDETMTGFRLTVPEGFRIVAAGGDDAWRATVEGQRATWTGGALAPLQPVVFDVEVDAAGVAPGVVELRGDQLYADGESTTWPVALTVVPPGESSDGDGAITGTAIAILAVLGALVVATFGLVFWQRRRESLQER